MPDISNPFFSLILQGIEDAAVREGYAVLLGDTQHDEAREERYAGMLKKKEADGLIFLGHRLPKDAEELVRATAPRCAPVVNGCEFSPQLGVPSVHIDNAKAAYEAMGHLYDLGHRRIAALTGPLVSPLSRDRLRGAMARATHAGAKSDFVVLHGDFSIESGIAAGAQLFATRDHPTAVFCFNDEMAMGVIEIARRKGVRVPDRSLSRRLRRHPLRPSPRPAADDDLAADARDRRRLRPAADRNPARQRRRARLRHAPARADDSIDDRAAQRHREGASVASPERPKRGGGAHAV